MKIKTSTNAALLGLTYMALALIGFVKDDVLLGFVFVLASVIFTATSFICVEIERNRAG